MCADQALCLHYTSLQYRRRAAHIWPVSLRTMRDLPASSEMTSRIFHKSGVREARSVIKVAAVLTVYLTGGR
uniref:SFRICE_025760 n=1 Tax=Spodoptera frugiperda TaxID=7108 RepID=A0A2H1WH43_SPOFR